MIGKKTNAVRQAPLYEVREMLKERSSDSDLNYEQNLAYEYSKKYSKLTPAKGEKMLAELKEIEGMTDSFSTNLMDIMPADLDIVKLLLPKGSAITEDQLKKIVSISEKYSK